MTNQPKKVMLSVILLLTSTVALSADRLALVIGNGQYRQASLQNATNDADDVARQLRSLGFDVTLKKNLNRKSIRGAFRNFSRKVTAETEVALIFYSGHGAQFENRSYLIPIGADINADEDLPDEAINARSMLSKIENRRAKVNVMILDACRNLPFNMASSNRSATRGLAKINRKGSTLIAYATASGEVAQDSGNNGRNSPYTEVLLKYLKKPDLTLSQMFNDIGLEVQRTYPQTPWVDSSSIPNVYLNKGKRPTQPTAPVVNYNPQPVNPVVQQPDSREIIRKIQVQLNRLQCNAGTADGKWGRKGRSALAKLAQVNPSLDGYSQPNQTLLDNIQSMTLQKCGVANFSNLDAQVDTSRTKFNNVEALAKKVMREFYSTCNIKSLSANMTSSAQQVFNYSSELSLLEGRCRYAKGQKMKSFRMEKMYDLGNDTVAYSVEGVFTSGYVAHEALMFEKSHNGWLLDGWE